MSTVYEIITDRIINLLEKGTVPWRMPWKGGKEGMPTNHATGFPYRGVNVFMLNATGYQSQRFVTFKQAMAKGGTVRKGEHGFPVIFWKQSKYEKKTEGGSEERTGFILRYYTVFALEQCDGLDYKPAVDLVEVPRIEAADRIVENYKLAPRIVHGINHACYRPALDQVMMPNREQFTGPDEYYSTLFHELGHSTGHKDRLNREFGASFGDHNYSKEELIAEFTASYLCGMAGIERTLDNSAAYIANWSRKLKSNGKWLVCAAAAAQKAADLILGKSYAKDEPVEHQQAA